MCVNRFCRRLRIQREIAQSDDNKCFGSTVVSYVGCERELEKGKQVGSRGKSLTSDTRQSATNKSERGLQNGLGSLFYMF